MPTKMPNKARKPKGTRTLRRHAVLIAGITLFWAAVNEPTSFAFSAMVVWALTAVAVAFVTCAALALLEPGIVILVKTLPRRLPPPAPAPLEVDEP